MPNFEKILNENISHSMILDRDGILKALKISYEIGKIEVLESLLSLDIPAEIKEKIILEIS
jgi:hypothetical protein